MYIKGSYKNLDYVSRIKYLYSNDLNFAIDFLENLIELRNEILDKLPEINKIKTISYLCNHLSFIENIIPKSEKDIGFNINTSSLVIKGYNYDLKYLSDDRVRYLICNQLKELLKDKYFFRDIKQGNTTWKNLKQALNYLIEELG